MSAVRPLFLLLWLVALGAAAGHADGLRHVPGRNEVRVYSAPFSFAVGDSALDLALPARLDARGYRRVHQRPTSPGEYFWGYESFWIYRQAYGDGGRREEPLLLELELQRAGGGIEAIWAHRAGLREPVVRSWLEPELLSESLRENRAARTWVALADLPEHVWRSVLAVEDSRFFSHSGVAPRSVARAMLKNALAGKVTQGGSTITQQLIKIRDLSPKRTMGRKVSEGVRALALEAEYEKREILEAYLNSVYMGHVGGVAIYGLESAAQAYFSRSATRLDVGEAALLAAMIQGPNRLNPLRHSQRVLKRQRFVLDRMRKLGWLSKETVARERRRGMPQLRMRDPRSHLPAALRLWIGQEVRELAPERWDKERGFTVTTTIDPHLQRIAEKSVAEGLESLRRRSPRLRKVPVAAALVALDATGGSVLAAVGGDPGDRADSFDRVRSARRQPGSAVKPFVMLEAFAACGPREPLHPASRIRDTPLRLDLPSGPWRPRNHEGGFRELVTARSTLVASLNVPTVRVARWCGFDATARRMRQAGISVPEEIPPSFVLGAVEVSPLELASAYGVFTTLGTRRDPRVVESIRRPSGTRIAQHSSRRYRVSGAESAYLVRDLLRDAVERGTARSARLRSGGEAFGKTGTSSGQRDAWFAGGGGSLIVAVWVGVDDGSALGLSGSTAAAPLWREFMERAAPARPRLAVRAPAGIVERWVDPETGRLLRRPRDGAERELFRSGAMPPGRGFWGCQRTVVTVE